MLTELFGFASISIESIHSHNLIVLSALPLASVLPSGEKATDSTTSLCPLSVIFSPAVCRSQTLIVLSYLPLLLYGRPERRPEVNWCSPMSTSMPLSAHSAASHHYSRAQRSRSFCYRERRLPTSTFRSNAQCFLQSTLERVRFILLCAAIFRGLLCRATRDDYHRCESRNRDPAFRTSSSGKH